MIASELKKPCRRFNAVTGNKKDLDAIFLEAKMSGQLILICDEVHRLNKDKQDLLLPHVEDGSIILIGATTANPYHSINPAIRSRCHLFEFKPLKPEDVQKGIDHALKDPEGLNDEYTMDQDAKDLICDVVNGDIRFALNILEISAILSKDKHITKEIVEKNCRNVNTRSFGSEDGYYDLLSALQKSIRGSDANAALYYLSLLGQSGDVASICRRLMVIAYEDIGLANPALAARTYAACQSAEAVGFPEAIIPLGIHIIDLCLSPKSRTGMDAIHKAEDIVVTKAYDMPKYLKLTPVGLNKDEQYSYERYDCFHKIQYLPDEIKELVMGFRLALGVADAEHDLLIRDSGDMEAVELMGIDIAHGAQDKKLVSAVAVAAAFRKQLLDLHGGLPEHLVARNVSVGIVDLLEIVDVEHEGRDRPVKELDDVFLQRLAVAKPCQPVVAVGVLQQIAVLLLRYSHLGKPRLGAITHDHAHDGRKHKYDVVEDIHPVSAVYHKEDDIQIRVHRKRQHNADPGPQRDEADDQQLNGEEGEKLVAPDVVQIGYPDSPGGKRKTIHDLEKDHGIVRDLFAFQDEAREKPAAYTKPNTYRNAIETDMCVVTQLRGYVQKDGDGEEFKKSDDERQVIDIFDTVDVNDPLNFFVKFREQIIFYSAQDSPSFIHAAIQNNSNVLEL